MLGKGVGGREEMDGTATRRDAKTKGRTERGRREGSVTMMGEMTCPMAIPSLCERQRRRSAGRRASKSDERGKKRSPTEDPTSRASSPSFSPSDQTKAPSIYLSKSDPVAILSARGQLRKGKQPVHSSPVDRFSFPSLKLEDSLPIQSVNG